MVVKRSGDREPFDREKVAIGIRLAAKGRPIEADGGVALDELISAVEDAIRLEGGTEVPTEAVGRAVLERLREVDPVAAVRFASVYLGFDDLSDFEREITLLPSAPSPSATSAASATQRPSELAVGLEQAMRARSAVGRRSGPRLPRPSSPETSSGETVSAHSSMRSWAIRSPLRVGPALAGDDGRPVVAQVGQGRRRGRPRRRRRRARRRPRPARRRRSARRRLVGDHDRGGCSGR